MPTSSAGSAQESPPTYNEAPLAAEGLDSTVTRFSEKFVLTPAESIVVRCDTQFVTVEDRKSVV